MLNNLLTDVNLFDSLIISLLVCPKLNVNPYSQYPRQTIIIYYIYLRNGIFPKKGKNRNVYLEAFVFFYNLPKFEAIQVINEVYSKCILI